MFRSSSSRLSVLWYELDPLLCRVLHCFPAVQQREVFAIAPHLCQVPIVRAIWIAGLAGVVDSPRIVPIAYINYNAYRRTRHLTKIADAASPTPRFGPGGLEV